MNLGQLSRLICFGLAASTATVSAQTITQSGLQKASPKETFSRLEVAGGYHFVAPRGDIGGAAYDFMPAGALVDVTYFINAKVGLQVEGDLTGGGKNDCLASVEGGPVWRFGQRWHLKYFAHADAGAARLGGPVYQPCTWGFGATGGVGTDYVIPLRIVHGRVAWRVIQADYEYVHVGFGPILAGGSIGGTANLNALRLGTGVVLRLR